MGKSILKNYSRDEKHKKYIIRNVYRVPNETVYDPQIFNDEFVDALEILQSKRLQTYLCGDYNIDLLKIYQKINIIFSLKT